MGAWVGPVDEPRRYVFDGRVEPVARGGEGFVYRARRSADGLLVAVKQLVAVPPGQWPAQSARLRLMGSVSHPSLGRHLDAFAGPYPFAGDPPPAEEFEVFYAVMAWVGGSDLTDAVGPAELAQVLGWVRDVAGAAAALHRHPTPTDLGIVHRDIKPSNVRVTPAGVALLVDFGIARPLDGSPMTRTAGAPGWMPPEAFTDPDRIGPRSDVWQVAGLAAWAVLGVAPGTLEPGDRRARLATALRSAGVAAAGSLARHIDGALATRPADRPADAERWGATLTELATTGRDRRRHLTVAAGAVVILLALAAAFARTRPADTPGAGVPAPVGVVTVGSGPTAPRDRGTALVVAVTFDPAPPAGARVAVAARAGGRPVPDVGPVEVPAEPPTQTVRLAVADGNRPLVVDQLAVRLLDPSGASRAEQDVPVSLVFAPPVPGPERCTAYERERVVVEPTDQGRARVMAGPVEVAELASRADADAVAAVAGQADERCLIGASGRPVQYWRRDGLLLGALPDLPALRNSDCEDYDPADLRVDDRALWASGHEPLAVLATPADTLQALAVAAHHRRECIVGRYTPSGVVDGPTVTYWQ